MVLDLKQYLVPGLENRETRGTRRGTRYGAKVVGSMVLRLGTLR